MDSFRTDTGKGLKIVVETGSTPGEVRALLKGQLTMPLVKQFQLEINRILLAGCQILELDLADLNYLDSSGLAAFIPVHQRMQTAGGQMRIRHPRKLIRHLFVSAHLDKVLDLGPEKG
jgi:anti-anti-sigma factor